MGDAYEDYEDRMLWQRVFPEHDNTARKRRSNHMGQHADDALNTALDHFVDCLFDDDVDHKHTKKRKRRNNHPIHTDNAEDTNMAKSLDVTTLFQMERHNVRLAGVHYRDGSDIIYSFKVPENVQINEGDYVVVPYVGDAPFSSRVVKFVGWHKITDMVPGIEYKWIIAVFNRDNYEALAKNDIAVKQQMAMSEAIAKAREAVKGAEELNWMPKSDNLLEDNTVTGEAEEVVIGQNNEL